MKLISLNRFGLLETTDALGNGRHKFFNHRSEAAKFLRKLRGLRRAHKIALANTPDRILENAQSHIIGQTPVCEADWEAFDVLAHCRYLLIGNAFAGV